MKPIFRPYQTEDDFWRMREFLRRVFLLNGCLERSWHVARLDYARWHSLINCAKLGMEDVAFDRRFKSQNLASKLVGLWD